MEKKKTRFNDEEKQLIINEWLKSKMSMRKFALKNWLSYYSLRNSIIKYYADMSNYQIEIYDIRIF